jgi:transcriptional regulator GlxA family with amidase domain
MGILCEELYGQCRPFMAVEDVIVSAGISAGIDMCLYLAARLHGEGTAGRTARYMEYSWDNETGG